MDSPFGTGLSIGRAPYRLRLAVAVAIAALSLSAALILIAMPGHGLHTGEYDAGGTDTAFVYVVAFSLWVLMSVAMMLPTAWGFVATYLDIAHAAREKDTSVPSAAVLIAGYLVVWTGFSAIAALIQISLHGIGLGQTAHGSVDPVFAGALLIGAGTYELTPLKTACLSKCRNPVAVLFAQFKPDHGRILRLGVQQGLFCLGCCWALMALMLATGVLHIGFMAILAAVMAVQKHQALPRFDKPLGFILIAGGLALLAWSGA
jgi:predicted metal-binding membrane protein